MEHKNNPSVEFLDSAHFLVDASSYIFRAYYGLRPGLTSPKGIPTHATFGFAQMLFALMDKYRPKNVLLMWDRPDKGFRHQIFPEYKANRTAPPEDLGIQIENSKKIVEFLGIPQVEKSGFEADDIIASFVHQNPGENFVIVTGDKDLLQLVGPKVWCLDTMKETWGGVDRALEKFGVPPDKIALVQALSGDSVDNIPGAPGIGPKTATELVKYYGSLEKILDEAKRRFQTGEVPKDKTDPLKGKRVEILASHRDKVETSLKLVSLNSEVPLEEQILQKPPKPQTEALFEFLRELGFQKMIDRLSKELNRLDPAAVDSNDQSEKTPVTGNSFFTPRLVTTLQEFHEVIAHLAQAPRLCLDTETQGLDVFTSPTLVGLSASCDGITGFYFPVGHKDSEQNLPKPEFLEGIRKLFKLRFQNNPQGTLIFQNAKFDLHVLAREEVFVPDQVRIDDTMVASYVLNPSESHGMDSLSQKYLEGYKPLAYKDVTDGLNSFAEVPLDKASFYAGEDAVVTWKLWNRFEEILKANPKLWNVYDLIDRPLVRVLFEMEETGVLIDSQVLKTQSQNLHADLEAIKGKALESLKESGIRDINEINLQSTKQIAEILFEKLGLPVIKRKKTGPSTDVSVLEELSNRHSFPGLLLEYRELSKLISTYIDALPQLINTRTGRVHTDFSQTITATGRLSSSNPNLQNIPIRTTRGKEIRKAFIAQAGFRLLGIDYSQIELRLLAELSADPDLKEAFLAGKDIHKATAARIFQKSESLVTGEERSIAKTINFGIIYGQTAFGLSKQLGISKTEAQNFIDSYFKTYPGIRAFTEYMIEKARAAGFVETATGRLRPLPEINSKNVPLRLFAERSALNSPLQGTAADLIKVAMVKIQEFLKKNFSRARLIIQVHDELLFEVPEEQVESLMPELSRLMELPDLLEPFAGKRFSIPMKVDVAQGRNWGDL